MSSTIFSFSEAVETVIDFKDKSIQYAKDHQHHALVAAVALFVFPSMVQGLIVGVGAKLIHSSWKRLDLDTHVEPPVKPALDYVSERFNIKAESSLETRFGKGAVSKYGGKFFQYINPTTYENVKAVVIATVVATALASVTGGGAFYIAGSLYAYARLSAMVSAVAVASKLLQPLMPQSEKPEQT